MFGLRIGKLGSVGGRSTPAYQALLDLFSNGEAGLLVPSINVARADGRLWQDVAKTTPAVAVNDPVAVVEDYSGNVNNLSQDTATARPLLKQDGSGNWYLQFDGTDDFLVTSSIDFTGTDKMTVWAAYESLSTAVGIIYELGTNLGTGAFGSAANDGGTGKTSVYRRGDGSGQARFYPAESVPLLALDSVVHDLSISGQETPVMRRNGAAAAGTGAALDTGVGPFGDYPLYIGSRGGTSILFNGRLYGLIVRGAISSQSEIEQAEAVLNSYARAY